MDRLSSKEYKKGMHLIVKIACMLPSTVDRELKKMSSCPYNIIDDDDDDFIKWEKAVYLTRFFPLVDNDRLRLLIFMFLRLYGDEYPSLWGQYITDDMSSTDYLDYAVGEIQNVKQDRLDYLSFTDSMMSQRSGIKTMKEDHKGAKNAQKQALTKKAVSFTDNDLWQLVVDENDQDEANKLVEDTIKELEIENTLISPEDYLPQDA
jgi:hypothetical protein